MHLQLVALVLSQQQQNEEANLKAPTNTPHPTNNVHYRTMTTPTTTPRHRQLRLVQLAMLLQHVLLFGSYASVIVGSKKLAAQVFDSSATASGWFIGGLMCTFPAAILVYYLKNSLRISQPTSNVLVVIGMFGAAFSDLLMAVLAMMLPKGSHFIFLILLRFISAFFYGLAEMIVLQRQMDLTPKQDQSTIQLLRQGSQTLAIALAYGTSGLFNVIFAGTDVGVDQLARIVVAGPVCIFAGLSLLFALLFWYVLAPSTTPSEATSVESMLHYKLEVDAALETAGQQRNSINHDSSTSTSAHVLLHVLFIVMERSLIIAALEAASSYLFEEQFSLSGSVTSLVLTLSMVVATVTTVLMSYATRGTYSIFGKLKIMVVCSVGVLASTVLCFPAVTNAVNSWYPIGIMDILIFSNASVFLGLAFGLAGEYFIPSSFWLSSSAFFVGMEICHTIGRVSGAPLARMLLSTASGNGQLGYAFLQMFVSSIGVAMAMHLSWIVFQVEKRKSLEEDGDGAQDERALLLG